MAITKLYDLAVKTGEYVKNGETKGRYENIGSVMQSDDGSKFLFIKRTFNPAGVPDLSGKGGESIIVSMFKPQAQDGQAPAAAPAPARRAPAPASNLDDDIPF